MDATHSFRTADRRCGTDRPSCFSLRVLAPTWIVGINTSPSPGGTRVTRCRAPTCLSQRELSLSVVVGFLGNQVYPDPTAPPRWTLSGVRDHAIATPAAVAVRGAVLRARYVKVKKEESNSRCKELAAYRG